MGQTIDLKKQGPGPLTEEQLKELLGPEAKEAELEKYDTMNVLFVPLDSRRTAIIGSYRDIEYIFDVKGFGKVEHRSNVKDSNGNDRGPGVILSVLQVVKLLNFLEADGWTSIEPMTRKVAKNRLKVYREEMREEWAAARKKKAAGPKKAKAPKKAEPKEEPAPKNIIKLQIHK